ncbi:MAG: sulfotransferase [Chloroflexi bacterium OLB15]|nr:MAG: sulfotransferase [Chloroflexi bacterium OLB15]
MLTSDAPTVFHFTHHKSGSQWIHIFLKSLASNRLVDPANENAQVLRTPIAPGMIYPTVYVTSYDFAAIPNIPEPNVKFVTIRDLRDTLISLYFSLRYSHPESFSVIKSRSLLEQLTQDEGLMFLIMNNLQFEANVALSWASEEIPLFRYEDMLKDEMGAFKRIVDLMKIDISNSQLARIVKACSFETLSAGRKSGQEDQKSHFRKGVSGDWRNYLQGKLLEAFKERYDDVLMMTGYETSRDWGMDLLPARFPVLLPAEMPPVRCWCGSDDFSGFIRDYSICSKCRTLVRVTPELTFDRSFETALAYGVKKRSVELIAPKQIVAEYLQRYIGTQGRVLDVAAYDDGMSSWLNQLGYAVTSPSNLSDNSNDSSEVYENARQEFVFDLPDDQKFDAIIFWDKRDWGRYTGGFFGDPLSNPQRFMERCRELLTEDGVLLAIPYMWNTLLPTINLSEDAAIEQQGLMQYDRYLYRFTTYSFERLLKSAGFADAKLVRQPIASGVELNIFTALKQPRNGHHLERESSGSASPSAWIEAVANDVQRAGDDRMRVRQIFQTYYNLKISAQAACNIELGLGWHNQEFDGHHYFRWAENDGEIIVRHTGEASLELALEVEPGPSLQSTPLQLQVLDRAGQILTTHTIAKRSIIHCNVPASSPHTEIFVLHAVNGGNKEVPNDPRILNFRLIRMDVQSPMMSAGVPLNVAVAPRKRRFISKLIPL